ncbi:MAG: hypothetical protein H6Q67_2279, partial [Firmicutes bacterium]|nr:hypothetical protein [Bacillota bacterium]
MAAGFVRGCLSRPVRVAFCIFLKVLNQVASCIKKSKLAGGGLEDKRRSLTLYDKVVKCE